MSMDTSMFPTLAQAEPGTGFLQVLCDRLSLRSLDSGGLEVTLPLHPGMPAINRSSQKAELAARIDCTEGTELERTCSQLRREPAGSCREVVFDNFVLRHGSGGVLPFVMKDGQRQLLLFERDIAPVGWNIANGAAADTHELRDVARMMRREAAEEILFLDPQERTVHALNGLDGGDEQQHALSLWRKELAVSVGRPLSWSMFGGPDRLVLERSDGTSLTVDELAITISAADFGIECVRGLLVERTDGLIPLDGEILGGGLLDRKAALFRTLEAARSGRPQQAWKSGKPLAAGTNMTEELCPVTDKLLRFDAFATRLTGA